MAEIYVDVSGLQAKAEELSALNDQFKTQVGTLQETESALNGMWEGTSKDTFHNAFNSDITQMNGFYNAILAYITRLQEITQAYATAEQKNAEIASERTYY